MPATIFIVSWLRPKTNPVELIKIEPPTNEISKPNPSATGPHLWDLNDDAVTNGRTGSTQGERIVRLPASAENNKSIRPFPLHSISVQKLSTLKTTIYKILSCTPRSLVPVFKASNI